LSIYVNGILFTDGTSLSTLWEICLHDTRSYVSCHATVMLFLIALGHMLEYIPSDRDFCEKK